jgi:hypothetical protein
MQRGTYNDSKQCVSSAPLSFLFGSPASFSPALWHTSAWKCYLNGYEPNQVFGSGAMPCYVRNLQSLLRIALLQRNTVAGLISTVTGQWGEDILSYTI